MSFIDREVESYGTKEHSHHRMYTHTHIHIHILTSSPSLLHHDPKIAIFSIPSRYTWSVLSIGWICSSYIKRREKAYLLLPTTYLILLTLPISSIQLPPPYITYTLIPQVSPSLIIRGAWRKSFASLSGLYHYLNTAISSFSRAGRQPPSSVRLSSYSLTRHSCLPSHVRYFFRRRLTKLFPHLRYCRYCTISSILKLGFFVKKFLHWWPRFCAISQLTSPTSIVRFIYTSETGPIHAIRFWTTRTARRSRDGEKKDWDQSYQGW